MSEITKDIIGVVLGTIFGMCIAMAYMSQPPYVYFKEAYEYIIPKGIGSAEEAYKCKKVDGEYIFTPQGSFCKFN